MHCNNVSFRDNFNNWLAGAGAGATGVLATQWLYNIKLDRQKGVKTSFNLMLLFAGLGAGMVGDPLGIATQNGVSKSFKTLLDSDTLAAAAGGLASAYPIAVTENMMDQHRQNRAAYEKAKAAQPTGSPVSRAPGYLNTGRKVYVQSGYRGFLKGVKCTQGREIVNAVALLKWTPELAAFYGHYTKNPLLAQAAAGATAGLGAALITQSLDTAKVKIQNDLTTGYLHSHFRRSFVEAYRQKKIEHNSSVKAGLAVTRGVLKEGYKGFVPRAGVLVVFLPTVNISLTVYSTFLQKATA